MGLQIKIPGSFSDSSLPILRDDPILTVGSIALIEMNHPAAPAESGVDNNLIIPNIAWKECVAAAGLSGQTMNSLSPILKVGAGFTGTKGLLERTGKGGLHGIASQAVALAAGDGAMIRIINSTWPVIVYMAGTAKQHKWYVSTWMRRTRLNPGNLSTQYTVPSSIGSGTGYLTKFRDDSNAVARWSLSGSKQVPASVNTVGASFIAVATEFDGSNASVNALPFGPCFGAPSGSDNATTLRTGYYPSDIFYRMYIEDLDVSGRSFATVSAIDYAEYQKQVTTVGGRYYNDTFTAPSTIA